MWREQLFLDRIILVEVRAHLERELILKYDCEGRAMVDLAGTKKNALISLEIIDMQYLTGAQGVN